MCRVDANSPKRMQNPTRLTVKLYGRVRRRAYVMLAYRSRWVSWRVHAAVARRFASQARVYCAARIYDRRSKRTKNVLQRPFAVFARTFIVRSPMTIWHSAEYSSSRKCRHRRCISNTFMYIHTTQYMCIYNIDRPEIYVVVVAAVVGV